MILCDREVKAALDAGLLVIRPRPEDTAFDSTTVDLRLGDEYETWTAPPHPIEPARPGFKYSELRRYHESRRIDPTAGLDVAPDQFLLAWTLEWVHLTDGSGLAARVEGKSSLARLGLGVHITAPTIQNGFEGRLQLEVKNFGPLTIRLVPGMRICQLVFERVSGTPERAYRGGFLHQKPMGESIP